MADKRIPMKPLKRGDQVFSTTTKAQGVVSSTKPFFAVKYRFQGKVYNRFSNPNYWKRR